MRKRGVTGIRGQLEGIFMFTMLLVLISFALILVFYIPAVPIGNGGEQPFVTSTFLDAMRVNSAYVNLVGPLNVSILSVPGTVYKFESEQMIIFEYSSVSDAAKDAVRISGNGSTIDDREFVWQASPHFYLSGRILVLYLGSSQQSLALLSYVLGQPFIGAPIQFNTACSVNNPCPGPKDICVAFLGDTLCLDKDPCTLCGTGRSCKKVGYFPIEVVCSK